jgi:malate dehydrogenase
MPRKKISVIGAGQVGATTAQYLVQRELGDIVLLDIIEGMPQGKSLDLSHLTPLYGHDATIIGTNNYEMIKGSDIVVMTAGFPRKPGMTREDLLKTNAQIVIQAMEYVVKYANNAIVIVVTNPLDIMTYLAYKVTKFPKNRIMGMAGVLDSTRFRYHIAEALKVSVKDVQAMVLGSHGDSMVPLPRYSTVAGISLVDLLPKEEITKLVERTRNAGTEIVGLLKTGSAYYAPAESITVMVESIVKDENRILPASVKLEGEYGASDVFIGVPIKLGENGVKEIIQLKLTDEEMAAFNKSVEAAKKGISELEKLVSI